MIARRKISPVLGRCRLCIAVAVVVGLAALAPLGTSQELAEWQDIEIEGLDLAGQKAAILRQLDAQLQPGAFDRIISGSLDSADHDDLEARVRRQAEQLEENWRQNYDAAAENYRETQDKRSTIRILADQMDNNLSLYRTELLSARSKRDGFFHALAGLGKSYTVLVRRPLTELEMTRSEEDLATLTEDCAKRSLAKVKSAALVISEFELTADDVYSREATMIISSADVVSQGSPPIWSFLPDPDGLVSFIYIQAYQVFPQYEPPDFTEKPLVSVEVCEDQATELTDLEILTELQLPRNGEIEGRLAELLAQRDVVNDKVREKLDNEYENFLTQMEEAKSKLEETRNSIRDDARTLSIMIDDLIEQIGTRHSGVGPLNAVQEQYAESQQLLGSKIESGIPILDGETWSDDRASREKTRTLLVETMSALAMEARERLAGAISRRSLILWQTENVFVQGDPREIAKRAVAGMIEILSQRADRLRAYKVLQLGETPSDQSLTSVVGTDFYQQGIPERIVFPNIRLHFRRNPGGTLSRSLEILLAVRFLYEQRPEDEKQVETAEFPEPSLPEACRQHLDAITSQEGEIRRSGDFVFLFQEESVVQAWYLGAIDRRLPRGRLEGAVGKIPCSTRWRLPTVAELRTLVDFLQELGASVLPEGLWTSEDDGLGTEWKIFFPQGDSEAYRGAAYMWWFVAVTDSPWGPSAPKGVIGGQS